MPDTLLVGVILGTRKDSPPGDFAVLRRVTRNHYPRVDINKSIRGYLKTGQYHDVWFVPIKLIPVRNG